MTILYLVRHAKPAATWGVAIDPGLDDLGRNQAQQAADGFQKSTQSLPIYTSPLKRCRETAEPLAMLWSTRATILPQVAEIPSPPLSMADKQKWLHDGMQGTWTQLQASAPADGSPDFLTWRTQLLQTLSAINHDSVIFTHYIAINVAVGAAQGHDRVLSFRPGHASITKLEVAQGRIAILELGKEVADGGVLLGK
jgi:broad specificity phosphatase PhoE